LKQFKILQKKGFKLFSNWQQLNNKSIYVLGTTNEKNFNLYVKKALKKKCKYICCHEKFKNLTYPPNLKIFYYKNNSELTNIAKYFFSKSKIKIIFITGTNGKTSIAYGCNKLFTLNKINSSYIGTLGFYINSKRVKKLSNTTPDYIEILNLIDHAERSKCKYLFIEASSIGYMEGRLGNLKFNLCLLTNLKSDHLDYHKNIKNYHLSKIDMIKKLSGKKSKILIQDYKLLSKLKTLNKTIYDQNNFIENHNLKIEIKNNANLNITINKSKFQIKTINDFVVKNTISILHIYYSLLRKFPNIINETIYPKGRSDMVFNKDNKIIIIDYAHTEDAFKNLLTSLNQKFNNIIVVYGCGGDRDVTKRSDIAKTVSDYSNLQIITDDNPRTENPKKIRDFLSKKSKNAISIANRENAIKYGIKILSQSNGLLIIAGKGHEDKQIYKNKVINISDHSIVKKYATNL
jgi:UDP-N-acetylmuramyl-tripeptide synthetase